MRLVCVSGTRGSGKTTLIRKLIDHLWAEDRRSAVVVNEDGETSYDQEFVERFELPVKYLRGG